MFQTLRRPASWASVAVLGLGCAAPADESPLVIERDAPRRASRPLPALAESEEDFDATELAACIEYGLEHSTRLVDAFEVWQASGARAGQVGALPEPRLSWTEFVEEVQTRTGPQERRIGLAQPFPWPGTLGTRERVAEHEAVAFGHRVESVRLEVERDIAVAFHAYAFLGRERGITIRLLDLLRGLEPVVQSRVRSGAGQEDLLRLQVEIGRLEDDLAEIERRRPALSARLADALSLRSLDEPLPIPELAVPATRALDVAALSERALAANPGLRVLRAEFDARREAETLAGKRRWPSFSLGVDWFQTSDALNPATPGSGDDPFALTLSMSLPLWTSSYRAAEREARHHARSSRARTETAESSLVAAIQDAAYRVDDAARRITLYRDSLIPRADEALRLTLSSYRTGNATLLDLIDSERALLEFELSLWRACREFLQGEARLSALTGEAGS